MPANLVRVMPDKTLLPVLVKAKAARSKFVPAHCVYALTMWEINSTPIPMHWKIIEEIHLRSFYYVIHILRNIVYSFL